MSIQNIRRYNIADLIFSIFPFGQTNAMGRTFITYRQYFMQFLNDNIDNSDFVIYTLAAKGIFMHSLC